MSRASKVISLKNGRFFFFKKNISWIFKKKSNEFWGFWAMSLWFTRNENLCQKDLDWKIQNNLISSTYFISSLLPTIGMFLSAFLIGIVLNWFRLLSQVLMKIIYSKIDILESKIIRSIFVEKIYMHQGFCAKNKTETMRSLIYIMHVSFISFAESLLLFEYTLTAQKLTI